MVDIRLSEVVSALTYALDLTEGQPEGHSIRSALIGMTLADHLPLSSQQRSSLFYALLLKDLGCSSTAATTSAIFGADDREAKFRYKTLEWTNQLKSAWYVLRTAGRHGSLRQRIRRVLSIARKADTISTGIFRTRCERGAEIARLLGFSDEVAQAILDLDEHWDGKGNPLGKKGEEISLLGRILDIAQTLEVFHQVQGPEGARRIARQRRGTWFDPALIDIFFDTFAHDESFWQKMKSENLIADISAYEPPDQVLHADQDKLDQIARAFARVI